MKNRRIVLSLVFLFMAALRSSAWADFSIWSSSTVPEGIDGGSDGPVELGVKFQTDFNGVVNGVRFYKAAANTGTHVGNLWTAAGKKLATVTFSGESASGWQQANFSTPVAISASTVYVVSYHANNGHYSADLNYFSTKGVDNAPLHALKAGVNGANGVYAYGTGSAFPSNTWKACNYWVDVAFQPDSQGTAQPMISAESPMLYAKNVKVGTSVTATFTKAMSAASINTATVFLLDSSNAAVPATVSYSGTTQTVTLTPGAPLRTATSYIATIKGGASGVLDTAGNAMNGDFTWTFTTATSYGALGGGPGGPILVVGGTANLFSNYYAEILLAEGFNEFALEDISSVSGAMLLKYDLVILGNVPLTASQVSMFTSWVNGGGKLIAMRPDKQLAGLLGLADAGSTLSNSYLLVNTASGPGGGIVGETIQFHGTADRYTLASGTTLAVLYSNSKTATESPAVTMRAVGSNGGQAAAFTYDLAQSVVFTRQGNPAWAGQDRDGIPPIRSNDLFYGAASFDPQPDWVDLNKVAIPQADEQQRLLANMIISMEANKLLLPRFWYWPQSHKAVIVMTGDDHRGGGTAGRFNQFLALSSSTASVSKWEAVRGTSYVFPYPELTNVTAAALNAQGFEISLHLNSSCSDWTRAALDQMFTDQLQEFASLYPSLPSPTTHRTHCIAWSDYTTMPEVELLHGIRLDTSYYYYPPNWAGSRPGFFTGSGLPMRFASATGSVIDVYQAPTQMTDESDQAYPLTVNALLDKALGAEGYYGAFVANMHTDDVTSMDGAAIIASAIDRDVPIISARQLLVWSDARNSSSIKSPVWKNNTMSFSVAADPNAIGLQAMVPVPSGYKVLSVNYNGQILQPTFSEVKGGAYAMFPALSGSYQVTYAVDTIAPVVSSIKPGPGATGVSATANVVVAFSEAMSPATIDGTTISLRDSSNTLVNASVSFDEATFTATLIPANRLSDTATYTTTVKGGAGGVADLAGNFLASDYKASFTTGSMTSISLWNAAVTPSLISVNDPNAVELGMKFMSAINGKITAISFYKGPSNTGIHVGNLWSSTGTLLATTTFINETVSGWQTQRLATPVAITANTTYVVSYHTTVGWYSADNNYFLTAGVDNGPLHALSNTEAGGNGVYRYGGSVFPSQTWKGSNYWVDVVFVPEP